MIDEQKKNTLRHTRIALGQEIQAQNNSTWNVSEEVGTMLQDHVMKRHATHILEIGTSVGYSTLFLAEAARVTGGHVTTIESHAARYEHAQKTFEAAEVSDVVTQIKGHAPEIFSTLTGTWDFIFLDATKYEHVSYVNALFPHLNARVCIVADNCVSHAEAMAPYIAYMKTLSGFRHELVEKGSGLFISTRD